MATSKLQIHTGQELRRRFSKYGIVENTRPRWLISTKGERLELDFYLERLGIAVEVQGKQHFEFTPVFHATKRDFQEQLRRDGEKLEICQRAGIDLLYVCKKSDVEIVLTACYDALRPSNLTPTWTDQLARRSPVIISSYPKTARKNLPRIRHALAELESSRNPGMALKRITKALRGLNEYKKQHGEIQFTDKDRLLVNAATQALEMF